jgi:hypothetical protein
MAKSIIRISVEDFDKIFASNCSTDRAIEEIKKHTVNISVFPKWEGNWDYYCSNCGVPNDLMTPHCPHCGAKMANGREDL